MEINVSILGALAALLGSVVGGSATIAAAWLTQKTQSERERVRIDLRHREQLYAEFVSECSKLVIDALDHTLDDPAKLQQVYALQNRVRLVGTHRVDEAADETVRRIVTQYLKRNLTRNEVQQVALAPTDDPLRPFADACRDELTAMRRAS